MRIGILDVDTKKETNRFGRKAKYPNIACGKIYGYHKLSGDEIVYPWSGEKVDRLYISTIFTSTRPMIIRNLPYWETRAKEILIGGSGWDDYTGETTKLPPEIEAIPHVPWTYELYGIDYGIGFTTRGCHVGCGFCMVWRKEGLVEYADTPISRLINPKSKHIVLMNNNSFAHDGFWNDIAEIKKHGLSVHWDQANDITLITPVVVDALKSVNYRGFDGKRKQLFFAFDLMKKRKSIVLETASDLVLDSLNIRKYENWYFINGEPLEEGKVYVNEHQDTYMTLSKKMTDGRDVPALNVEFHMISVVPRQVELMKRHGIPPHHLVFYMLIGYNTTETEDLTRVECLKKLGCEIYPMLYRDLNGKHGVDWRGKPQPFHARSLRDWINSGVYRKTPFNQFERREKHKAQRESEERQMTLF